MEKCSVLVPFDRLMFGEGVKNFDISLNVGWCPFGEVQNSRIFWRWSFDVNSEYYIAIFGYSSGNRICFTSLIILLQDIFTLGSD